MYISRSGGACLGTCPDYDLVIFSNGRVVFRGNGNTAVHGVRTTRVSPTQFKRLTQALTESDFFRKPLDEACITDQPVVNVEAIIDGERHQRSIDAGCPSNVENFWPTIDLIEKLAGVRPWVGRRR